MNQTARTGHVRRTTGQLVRFVVGEDLSSPPYEPDGHFFSIECPVVRFGRFTSKTAPPPRPPSGSAGAPGFAEAVARLWVGDPTVSPNPAPDKASPASSSGRPAARRPHEGPE